MNITRRLILQLAPAVIASTLYGCASRPPSFTYNEYSEEVSSVLISEDGTKLVVMTNTYHYIFDAPPIIINALKGNFRHLVNAAFRYFTVDSSNNITGSIQLYLQGGTELEKKSALNLGFDKFDSGILKGFNINGVRYKSDGFKPIKKYKLNRTYTIKVLEKLSSKGQTDISETTPIIIQEGLIKIAGTILMILASPIIILDCSKPDGCLR